MKILWYCICALAIVQTADFVTWLLKKTAGKKKKEKAKETDSFWKKVKWGIAAAVLVLVFCLGRSESVCNWIAAHNVSNDSFGLMESIVFYLGALKFVRAIVYVLRLYAWRETGHSPTEKEILELRIALAVSGLILAVIALCGWLGTEYFLLFFIALLVLALIVWITSPIVLKVIKK